jgi:hypothetical protein
VNAAEREAARALRRSNAGNSWTQDELRQLEEHIRMGMLIPVIADCMGRSQEAIRGKAQTSGWLTKRPRKSLK